MIAMQYVAEIDLTYVADQALAADARDAMALAIEADLRKSIAEFTVSDLVISTGSHGSVTVRAIMHGSTPRQLTSPVVAISRLDLALDHALMNTGQYEEFDVSRRALRVSPYAAGPK